MASRLARLLGGALRPGEGAPVLLLFIWCFAGVGAVWLSRAVRDTLFLTHVGAARLPAMYIATPLATTLAGATYARVADHVPRDGLTVASALLMAGTLLGARLLLGTGAWIHYALYIAVDVMASVASIQFWTVASDQFTAREGKRLFGIIGAGGTLAYVVIGFGASGVARRAGAEDLLLAAGGLYLATGALALALARAQGGRLLVRGRAARPPARAGRLSVPGSRHLRVAAAIIVCAVVATTVLDFQWKSLAARSFAADEGAMVSFFGLLAGATGAVSLLIQLGLSARLLARIGVPGTLLILPVCLGLGSAWLVILPGLAAATFAKAADTTLRRTLHDAGIQLLYLPVPPRSRGRAKTLLEGVLKPATEALVGAGLLLYGRSVASLVPLAAAGLGVAALWILSVLRLFPAYLASLRETLRQRRLELEGRVGLDAAAALATTLEAGTGERELLAAMELAPAGLAARVEPLLDDRRAAVRAGACAFFARAPSAAPAAALRRRVEDEDEAVRRAAVRAFALAAPDEAAAVIAPLLSSESLELRAAALAALVEARAASAERLGELLRDPDPRAAGAALAAAGVLRSPALVPDLVACLARRDVGDRAVAALAAYGPGVEEQLAALLRGGGQEPAVRRRLPRVLAELATRPAAAALVAALAWGDEPMRDAVLRALARAHRRNPALPVDRARLGAACAAEIEAAVHWLAAAEAMDGAEGSDLLVRALDERSARARDRLFLLLDLLHPRDGLAAVTRNLADPDPLRRANAVEMLDGMLPRPLRRAVIPLVEEQPRAQRLRALGAPPARSREAWLRELLAADAPWLRACAGERGGAPAVFDLFGRVRFLARMELFSALDSEDLAEIARRCAEERFEPGATVVREGDLGDRVYFVVSGRLEVVAGGRVLGELGEREIFGEMALLDPAPRSASVVARSAVVLLGLGRDDFHDLMRERPEVPVGVMKILVRRLRTAR